MAIRIGGHRNAASFTPATPSTGAWPDATNTGWQVTGATLTTYTGPFFFRDAGPVLIDAKVIGQTIQIEGNTQLVITRSSLTTVDCSYPATARIEDSNCAGGQTSAPVLGYDNLTVRRCNITGGQHSVMCGTNGVIEDNFMHQNWNDPTYPGGYHNNSYISNGGTNVVLRHNVFQCDTVLTPNGGGPTGDASIFGDFGRVTNYTFDGNLFKATTGSYGGSFGYNPAKNYGSDPVSIVVVNNVFERGTTGKCGVYGPATSFLSTGPGNVWTNNRFDDGTDIPPPG